MKTIAFTVSNDDEMISDNDQYVAKELINMGYHMIALHWQKKIPNLENLMVVFRSHWNYHHHYIEFMSWLNDLELQKIETMNSISLVKWNSNKKYLIDLQKRGIRIPFTKEINNFNMNNILDLEEFKCEELVVKPMIGASGYGVHKLKKDDFNSWWSKISEREKAKGWILQEFEEAINLGELSLIFFDLKYSHCIKKIPQKGEFRVNTQYDGKLIRVEPEAWIIDEAEKILHSLDEIPMYARVDLVVNKQGEVILFELEVNEPSLYFSLAPEKAGVFAKLIANQCQTLKW